MSDRFSPEAAGVDRRIMRDDRGGGFWRTIEFHRLDGTVVHSLPAPTPEQFDRHAKLYGASPELERLRDVYLGKDTPVKPPPRRRRTGK